MKKKEIIFKTHSTLIFFRRLYIIIFIASLFSTNIYSQYSITGKIFDVQRKPIDFAEIGLLQDSIIVKREVSDPNGNFTISQNNGTYTLHITQMGKVLFDSTFVLNRNINLGNINTEALHELNEVVIEAYKPLFKQEVDRLVFNVASDKYTEGLNAIQVLSRTPRLEVDFNNSIKMLGKGKVLVMTDGRLLTMSDEDVKNRLRSIRAEDIESIEVIPVPPARYSAEGNSGMINIVMKKNPNLGFQGFANTNLTYNKKLTTLASVNTNYRTAKVEFLLNANFNEFRGINDKDEQSDFTSQAINMSSKNDFANRIYSLNSALNFNLSKSTKIGVSADYNITNVNTSLKGTNIFYDKINSIIDSTVVSNSKTHVGPEHSVSLSSYIDHYIDDKGKKISIAHNYFRKKNTANTDLQAIINKSIDLSTRGLELDQNNKYIINAFFVDIELPLSFVKLEIGSNYTAIANKSGLLSFQKTPNGLFIDSLNSNTFEYKEYTKAVYFSVNKELSSKWSAKLGLRYEHTSINGYSHTLDVKNIKNYGYFFPSLFLLYNMNNKNTFTMSYAARIQRPNFVDLDPFRFYTTLYTYNGGNPFLQPVLTHNVELNYTHNNSLFIGIMGTRLLRGMDYVAQFDKSGVQSVSPINHFNQNRAGAYVNYAMTPSKWWRIQTSGYTLYSYSKSYKPELQIPDKYGFTSSINILNNFTLNKANTLFLELSYMQIFPSTDNFTHTKAYANTSASISCFLLDRQLQLRLSGNDIFRQSIFYNERDFSDFRWKQRFDFYGQNISISVQYLFGNKKMDGINKKIKETDTHRTGNRN